MKKKYVILFFLMIVFSAVELMAFSTPSCQVFILNKTEESIYLDIVIHPELIVERNGIKIFSFAPIHRDLDVSIYYLGEGRQIVIKPAEQQICYWFNQYYNVQRWFRSLGPFEQFKLIYKEFTVRNEKGEILLDMSTLKPESFENDPRGTIDFYLVIN